jgi:hypothetical protein
MRIPTVFAIVLVAASGAASAEPERVGYGDTPAPKHDATRHDGDWKALATPTPAKHGTEFVVVGAEQGYFDRLRLAADKGTVVLRRVKVYFDDGKEKVVQLDRVLGPKHPSADVDLGVAKKIDRIVVTTEPQGGGEYELYGSSGTGVAAR